MVMKIPSSVLFAVLLSSLLFALSSQQETVPVAVSEVSSIVSVSGDLNFSNYIPGEEYSRTVAIGWNVPASSLYGIKSQKVRVFVRLEPSSAGSPLFFRKGQSAGRQYFTSLECVVENGACAPGSVLSRTLEVFFNAPAGASADHALVVNASFSPLVSFASANALGSFFVLDSLVDETVSNAELFAIHLKNNGIDVSQSDYLLGLARQKQDEGDSAAAITLATQAIEAAKLANTKDYEARNAPVPKDAFAQASDGIAAAASTIPGAAQAPAEETSSITGMFTGANAPWFWSALMVVAFSFLYLKKRDDWQQPRGKAVFEVEDRPVRRFADAPRNRLALGLQQVVRVLRKIRRVRLGRIGFPVLVYLQF